MSIYGVVLAASLSGGQVVQPVLWLHPKGEVLVGGKAVTARLAPGSRTVRTPYGLGLDVNGKTGGLILADLPALALTRSFTVSTSLYLRNYAGNGWQAQVLFRGDDRPGFDPYHLTVEGGGTVSFGIDSQDGFRTEVRTEIPLNAWVRITASYDAEGHELRLWLGSRLMATSVTAREPFALLDSAYTPGVSLGNVESDTGGNNQPLDGVIADLRLYDIVVEPGQPGIPRG